MAAEKGNKYAEKWTKATTMEALEAMQGLMNQEKDIVFIGELISAAKLYGQIWSEWKRKFKDEIEVYETIKKIETTLEARLFKGALTGKYVPSVAIFGLKNNHKWTDKSQVDVTSGGKSINVSMNLKQ